MSDSDRFLPREKDERDTHIPRMEVCGGPSSQDACTEPSLVELANYLCHSVLARHLSFRQEGLILVGFKDQMNKYNKLGVPL